MALITKGPLKGFYLPDYDGGSIVNLLSSIIRSRGGHSPHRGLKGLSSRKLASARSVVYLVVDGLGTGQLDRFLEGRRETAFFGAHPYRVISTVFPATTAAAVTTFATGASPAEHGILGWHLHLPDLGMVSTILPGTTRVGMPMVPTDFDLGRYLRLPSYLDSTKGRRELVSYGHIPRSRYSQVGTHWHRRASFSTLEGMSRQVTACTRRRGPGLAYVYWPEYDTLCHEYGCFHAATERHLQEIDAALARLTDRLRGTGTMLLVLADHGLVDSTPRTQIDLAAIPGFYDCLAVLPSGDARQVCCFVRPSKVKAFEALVNRRLSKACVCVPGEVLIEKRVFGSGTPHPALRTRLGDYVLLARGSYAFTSTLPGSETDFNVGNHGGMSPEEVMVPLYAIDC